MSRNSLPQIFLYVMFLRGGVYYCSIQDDYRQTFILRAINSNYRYRVVLPEEIISSTETDPWECWQKIPHYRILLPYPIHFHYRDRSVGMLAEFLTTVFSFHIQLISISSKRTNSAMPLAATVQHLNLDQSALMDASLWRNHLWNQCQSSSTRPKYRRSESLWERI